MMRCGTDCVKNVAASIDLCRARRANSTNSIAYGAIPGRKTPVVPLSSSCSTIDASDVMVAQDDPDQAKNSGRRVRFSDEQGGPLVTGVRTMTSWWDELVFGADTCSDCGHCPQGRDAPSGIDIGGITQTQMKEARCEGCGGIPKNDPPGELFYFIEELTQGVEVTLGLPGLVGKRRQRVLLYTVDNGESLCWREAFSGCGAAYRLPCSGLLEVTEKSGATVMAEDELDVTTSERESNETGDMTQADDQEGMPSASLITSSASHAGSPRIGNLPCDGSGSVTGERGIRIRLRNEAKGKTALPREGIASTRRPHTEILRTLAAERTKSVHSDPPAVRRPCAIEAGSQGCEANCASQSEYAAAQKDGGPACRPLPDYWVSRSFSLVILILT